MKPVDTRTLETVDMIAAALSQRGKIVVGNQEFAEAVRLVVGAVREYQRVSPAEERQAWDAYLAASLSSDPDSKPDLCAKDADKCLAERRERFGGSR